MKTLHEIRLGKGLTVSDLAKKAEVSERTINEIEKGNRNVQEKTLFALARALDMNPAELEKAILAENGNGDEKKEESTGDADPDGSKKEKAQEKEDER
jgi:transcriptional regulator with XRE-family HTH domain